jgi:sugar transferase (PEP-CTERM/EpsH1 system associated)
MIRALTFLSTLPYPPRSGGDLRAWHLLRHLSAHVQQTVFCRCLEPATSSRLSPFDELGIEVVAHHLPRPGPLTKLGKGLRFLAGPCPVASAGWYFQRLARRLETLLRESAFDVIQIETSWLGVYWPILRAAPALKVLDLYDLNGERLARQAALLPAGPARWWLRQDARRMERLERRLIAEADVTLVTSARERAALNGSAPRIHVIPNGVDCDAIRPLPPASGREILFVGSLNYEPNVDAVIFFAREVFPAVRQRAPAATFTVVGRAPPPEILALQDLPGIRIAGEVADVKPCYQRCALCVVPLRAGGGTRLKILEAMAFARAIVSTPQGCEGLEVQNGQHLVVAEQPARLAEAILDLLEHPERAQELARAGRKRAEESYDWKKIASDLYALWQQNLKRQKR